MIKRFISLLIAIIMAFALVACENGTNDVDNTQSGTNETGGQQQTENMEDTNPVDTTQDRIDEDWGVLDDYSGQNEELNVSSIYFRWPTARGRTAATGKGATQGDGTYVLVDGYVNGISPKGVALEEFFPKYFDQTLNAFARNYGSHYSDGALTATMDGVSTINGYKVCKYTGQHSFKFKDVSYTYQYVAYVTTLKANGAYVYWLVQDETKDQSAGKQMEENALKIIQSLYEEE